MLHLGVGTQLLLSALPRTLRGPQRRCWCLLHAQLPANVSARCVTAAPGQRGVLLTCTGSLLLLLGRRPLEL